MVTSHKTELYEASNSIIVCYDNEGVIRYINKVGLRFFGYTSEELIGQEVGCLIPNIEESTGRDLSSLAKKIIEIPAEHVVFENENVTKEGKIVWIAWTNQAILNEQGEVLEILAIGNCISALKESEENLAKEKAFLRTVIDSAEDLIYFKDRNSIYIGCNKVSEAFTGLAESEQIGKSDFDFFGQAQAEAIVKYDQNILENRTAVHTEDLVTSPVSGEQRVLDTVKAPILGPDGQAIGLVGISRDITERKKALEALQKSEEKTRLILDSAAEAIYGLDSFGNCTFCNQSCLNILGYPSDEGLLGRNVHELIHHTTSEGLPNPVEECLIFKSFQHGEKIHIEIDRLWKADGTSFTAEVWSHPIKKDDAVIGAVVTFNDITEHKQSEEKLKQSHNLLSKLARLVPGVIYQYRLFPDGSSAFPYSSPGMNDIYEVSPEEVQEDATPVFGRLHPDDYDMVANLIQVSAQTLKTFYCEFRVILPRQGLRWRWSQAHPERLDDGSTLWHGIISDVTERKSAEIELKTKQYYLTKAQEIGNVGTWELDILNDKLVWTDENCRIFGVPVGSIVNYQIFINKVHPEDRDYVNREWEAATHGKPYDIEHRILVDGETRWVREKADLTFDEQGKAVSAIGFSQDITDQKRAMEEKTKLEQQLHQAQKIESIGQLAGGVAHDFNNMLGVILGHADMALRKADPASPLISDLEEIGKAANRSADLTRQLLTFARKQAITPKVLDLNESVAGTLKLLQRLIGENIQLSWNPAANLWPVKVDPSQIDQILTNLCVNSRDAISGSGKISIKTANTSWDEDAIASRPYDVELGDYVLLSVSDDGCGMDKKAQTHIFEPFYTTKEVGSGTGLGLATVYGAVKQNRGFFTVYSEPGLGTVFNIYFPRTSKAAEVKSETAEKRLLRGNETVLLVEDDEMLLRLVTSMLEESGYTVLAADTTALAQSLAKEHPGPIHLLISDVIMPVMNGRELSERLMPLRPDMKILFLSGYTADIISSQGVIEGKTHFLQKPFSLEVLTSKVREVLEDH